MSTNDDVIEHFIRDHIQPHDIAFDVGAHHGLYTCLFADLCEKVVAFEPNPVSAAALRQNIQRYDNVTLVEAAVSDSAGHKQFQVDDRPEWGGVASSLERIDLPPDHSHLIEMQCVALDAYCATHAMQPNFVKIDVEGHEPRVFAGAARMISERQPILIFEFWESWWGRGFSEIFSQLKPSYHLIVLETGQDAWTRYSQADDLGSSNQTVNIGCVPRR